MTAPVAPATPAVAASVFGDRLGLAERYAGILATRGVEWGLIGPREVGRLWDRHLLNSVAVASAIPAGVRVVDVGSGAGLPGIPLALARPDLSVTLLEPLLRRATFLTEAVDELGLGDRVRVVRGRAMGPDARDAMAHHDSYDAVTSRAVAPLPRLLDWCAPLLASSGVIVALKGASAADEVTDARAELKRYRLRASAESVSPYPGADPTWLVVCTR
ncbi:16S rRNA (guanine(527)-N(7))-methyltransferase RsmG [Propioniciclava sp.]|uniref:16S rRNA (guanine(527)-N(7))-methyltransferase RsmG n=1 Tax=Propioniciclava sp. TaxID=2038686 RepID=UPI0039E6E710